MGVDNSPSRYRWYSFYLVGEYTTLSDKPIHLRDTLCEHTRYMRDLRQGKTARPLPRSHHRTFTASPLLLMQDSYADASHHLEPMYIHYERLKEESVHVDMYLSVVRSSSSCNQSVVRLARQGSTARLSSLAYIARSLLAWMDVVPGGFIGYCDCGCGWVLRRKAGKGR